MGDGVREETSSAKVEASVINQDEMIIQQQRQIEKEISDTTPLVGPKEDVALLEKEYVSDQVYILKVRDLASKYSHIRRMRPDGNCFFRAFVYAYFERLLTHKEEYESFHQIVSKSKDNLVELGFPQFTVEDFHDTFMEVVERVGAGQMTPDELQELFNHQGQSDYIVVYLRLITSGKLQRDSEFYQNFIEGDRTVTMFCHQGDLDIFKSALQGGLSLGYILNTKTRPGDAVMVYELNLSEVEPMNKESDHIHIIALSSALNVGVRVRYMDRGDSSEVIAHDFPEGCTPAIHLLYRPGHYDILYL